VDSIVIYSGNHSLTVTSVAINLKFKVSSMFIHCCKAVVLVKRKSSNLSSLMVNFYVSARVADVCGC
jgi:hypothetical protein